MSGPAKVDGSNAYARRKARRRKGGFNPKIRWPNLGKTATPVGGGKRDATVVIGIGHYAYLPEILRAADNAADCLRICCSRCWIFRWISGALIRLFVKSKRDSGSDFCGSGF